MGSYYLSVEILYPQAGRLLAVHFSLEVCAGSRIVKLGRGGLGTRGEWRAIPSRSYPYFCSRSRNKHSTDFKRKGGLQAVYQAGNGRLWGNDRRTKGDVGKAKLFERGTKCREKKSSLSATLMRPQSLMHAACVLELIFQQTRNKIP